MADGQTEFGPVVRIEADAVGPPGRRAFRLLATRADASAWLWVEREQLQALAMLIEQLLTGLPALDLRAAGARPSPSAGAARERALAAARGRVQGRAACARLRRGPAALPDPGPRRGVGPGRAGPLQLPGHAPAASVAGGDHRAAAGGRPAALPRLRGAAGVRQARLPARQRARRPRRRGLKDPLPGPPLVMGREPVLVGKAPVSPPLAGDGLEVGFTGCRARRPSAARPAGSATNSRAFASASPYGRPGASATASSRPSASSSRSLPSSGSVMAITPSAITAIRADSIVFPFGIAQPPRTCAALVEDRQPADLRQPDVDSA